MSKLNTAPTCTVRIRVSVITLFGLLLVAIALLAALPGGAASTAASPSAAGKQAALHNFDILALLPARPGSALPVTRLAPPAAPRVVLHDQYDYISPNATNSQQYEPSMLPYNDFLADDIVVPAGETWTIDEVDVAALITGGSGPVYDFNVYLYTDVGLPGTQIYTATLLAYSTPVAGEFAIPLPVPAVVGPGTYWVMVQANLWWFSGQRGQWGWYNRSLQYNYKAAWINPGNGWGTSCNEDTGWGVRWVCQGDVSNPDQVFRVLGTSQGPGATNTPTNTPVVTVPVPTATRTPTRTSTPTFTFTSTATQPPQPTGTVPTHTPTHVPTNIPTATPTSAGATPVTATPTSIVLTNTPTVCPIQFTDVPVGSTFYPYIRCLACRGIINGYPDNTFRPNNNVTRGQLSKIVSNAAGFNDPQITQMFEDVPTGSTFFDFVGRLASRGYISGYPCGGPGEPCGVGNLPYFRTNSNATRGQISKIVSNAAGFIDPPGTQLFEDVPPGSTFYDYVQRLASRTIINGYPCGGPGEPCGTGNLPYFRPNSNATRGQISKIVANTFFPNCQTPAR